MKIVQEAVAAALTIEHALDHLLTRKPVTATGAPIDILGAAKALAEGAVADVEKVVSDAKSTTAKAVKGFDDIVADASITSGSFKGLRDSKLGEIGIHQQAIAKLSAAIATLNQEIAAATAIATQADATAAAIDAVIAPIAAAKQAANQPAPASAQQANQPAAAAVQAA